MTSNKGLPITNEAAVGLPPLRQERKAIWDYCRIEFLPDGYPGRRTDGELYAHPIYGPYVIADYLAQYRTSRSMQFLDGAIRVADAALGRMEGIGDGLAFLYTQEDSRVSSKKGEWYSALTQARYIDAFSKISILPGGDRFIEALGGVLSSLGVPVTQGGVSRELSGGGLLLEEYPSLVPDCTLNGWATATQILRAYGEASGDSHAGDLASRSAKGIEGLLPLYGLFAVRGE